MRSWRVRRSRSHRAADPGPCYEVSFSPRAEEQLAWLAAQLFATTDRIASYDWGVDDIGPLLRQVSSAMTDEVELLESLPLPEPWTSLVG